MVPEGVQHFPGGGGGAGVQLFPGGVGDPNANFHRNLSILGFSRQGVCLSPSGSAHVLPSLAARTH